MNATPSEISQDLNAAELQAYVALAQRSNEAYASVREGEQGADQVGLDILQTRREAFWAMQRQLGVEGASLKAWALQKSQEALSEYFGGDEHFSLQPTWSAIDSVGVFSCKCYCNNGVPPLLEEPTEDGTLPSFAVLQNAMTLTQENPLWYKITIDLKRYCKEAE